MSTIIFNNFSFKNIIGLLLSLMLIIKDFLQVDKLLILSFQCKIGRVWKHMYLCRSSWCSPSHSYMCKYYISSAQDRISIIKYPFLFSIPIIYFFFGLKTINSVLNYISCFIIYKTVILKKNCYFVILKKNKRKIILYTYIYICYFFCFNLKISY